MLFRHSQTTDAVLEFLHPWETVRHAPARGQEFLIWLNKFYNIPPSRYRSLTFRVAAPSRIIQTVCLCCCRSRAYRKAWII
jgi:hypothetical protein